MTENIPMIAIPQNYTKYLIIPLLGFLVSYLLVPAVMAFAARIGMVDKPDERRIHKGIIPRGGGLAVFVGFHLACAAIYFLPWYPFSITLSCNWWLKFLPASLFLVIVGVADDRWGLQPRIKLGCQILVAVALYTSGVHLGSLFYFTLPWPVDCILTVFWCVGFINAFNLIDGLDGLATGLGIIAAFGVAGAMVIQHLPGNALVLLGLIGACLGFLRYNFNPARVFLGDTGSMFIGFTLAAISLSTGSKGTIVASMAVPLLAAGVPILDTALAIWRRSVRRLRQKMEGDGNSTGEVFSADKDHLHHRLLRTGQSQKKVAVTLYAINSGLVAVGLLSLAFHSYTTAIYLVTFVVASYVIVRHLAHVELWDSGIALVNGLRRPPGRAVAVMAYPISDLVIMAAAFIPALWMTQAQPWDLKRLWLEHVVNWVPIPFICLAASGAYNRVWSRARIMDYGVLGLTFTGGLLVAIAANTALVQHLPRQMAIESVAVWSCALVGLMGIRLLPRFIQDSLPFLLRQSTIAGIERVPCLVYGAGYSCTLFLRAKSNVTGRQTTHRVVVGLLDDDSNLHGRTVYGYRVLGGIEKLEGLVTRFGVQEIVVTTLLDASVIREVEQFVRDHNLRLLRWRTDLHSQEAADLHFRFDFGLRATTTRMLATTPESLAADVEFCLSSSATLTGTEGCGMALVTPGTEGLDPSWRWITKSSQGSGAAFPLFDPLAFPCLMRELQQLRVVMVKDIETLRPKASSEKEFMRIHGMKSAIVIPLNRQGELAGFVAYYGVHSSAAWDKGVIDLITVQADIMVLALMRLQSPAHDTKVACLQ